MSAAINSVSVKEDRLPRSLALDLNNNRSSAMRCLFGSSDPRNTEALLKEQYQENRVRFLTHYGVDIEDVENEPVDFCEGDEPRKGAYRGVSAVAEGDNQHHVSARLTQRATRTSDSLHANAFRPYNSRIQKKMTDFLKERKAVPPLIQELEKLKTVLEK